MEEPEPKAELEETSATTSGTTQPAVSKCVAPPARSLGIARRIAMHALAAFILYGNVAVALQPPPLAKAKLGLPHPAWMHDAFLMTGMFSSYTKRNADVFIGGERTQAGRQQDRGKWIRLPIRDHFPDRHGVVFVRMFAAHHWDVLGPTGQKRAWKLLAKRIRLRHNRLHPEAPIQRVRFGQVDWPQSSRGYRARKTAAHLRVQTWFEDRPAKRAPKDAGKGAP